MKKERKEYPEATLDDMSDREILKIIVNMLKITISSIALTCIVLLFGTLVTVIFVRGLNFPKYVFYIMGVVLIFVFVCCVAFMLHSEKRILKIINEVESRQIKIENN